MAKVIRYTHRASFTYMGENGLQTEEVLTPITLRWSEANECLAKREADAGLYIIEDDGKEPVPAEQIAALKKQLAATDYKVIKCAECMLLGLAMPYDMGKLHGERQLLRDQINGLEACK